MKKLWLCVVCFTSCGKPYKAPDVALSETFLTQAASLNHTEFNPCYWKLLQDPTLDRLVELVSSHNYSYLAAYEKITQLRANYGLEKSKLYPTIKGTGFAVRNRNSQTSTVFFDPKGATYGNLYGIGFDSKWELDLFGSQLASKQSAFFTMMTQVEKAAYMKLSLISELVIQYIFLRTEQALIKLYEQQIEVLQEIEGLSNTRFTSGLNDQTTALSCLARIQDKKALREKTEAFVSGMIFSLTKLTGQFPDKEYQQLSAFKALKTEIPLIYPELPSTIILNRPDVKQARYSLFAAQASLKKAYRDFFPQFNLTSLWGVVSNYSNQLFKSKSIQWDIIPGFNVTLIDFGALICAKNAAKSVEKQALYTYQESLVNAFSEIETALAGIKGVDLEIKAYQQELQVLELKTAEFQERYKAGLNEKGVYLESFLEQLVVQEALIAAIKLRYSYAIGFYKALGVAL